MPSVPARKGLEARTGSHVPATTPVICHRTCRSREKSISVTTSSSERKGRGMGTERQRHHQVPSNHSLTGTWQRSG